MKKIYQIPLDEIFKLRVNEEQKKVIMSGGTSGYWRDLMIQTARENLGLEVEFDNLEQTETETKASE